MRSFLTLLGCAAVCAAAGPDYFPLQVGNRWVLQASSSLPGVASRELLTIEVRRSRVVDGVSWFLVAGYAPGERWLRVDTDGTVYSFEGPFGQSLILAQLNPQAPGYQTPLSGCAQPAQPVPALGTYAGPYISRDDTLTIQYSPGLCRDVGLTREVYAPAVGPVHRTITTFRGEVAFHLIYARIGGTPVLGTAKEIVLPDDFSSGSKGWLAGFSDYSLRTSDLRMLAEQRVLPEEASSGLSGYYIQSMNRSDDVFMFLKKRVSEEDGLEPNRSYVVSFDLQFLSSAPSGCVGAGGSPGESVYLKLGATADEAVPSVDASGDIRLRIDKGNQSTGGRDASVAGTIANGAPCEGSTFPWIRVRKTWQHPFEARTDDRASLWRLVGTDSAFEGLTGLYFESITVRINPAARPATASGSSPQSAPVH